MLPHLFDVGVAVLDHEIPGVQLSLGLLQVLLNSHPSLAFSVFCKERNICKKLNFLSLLIMHWSTAQQHNYHNLQIF